MLYDVGQMGISPNPLYRLEIEAESEAEAKDKYETQRGLVKGVNALVATPLSGEVVVEAASPFGLKKSDRYEPYVKPEPEVVKPVEVPKAFPDLKPAPVPEPVAAKVDSVGEEVLIVSN